MNAPEIAAPRTRRRWRLIRRLAFLAGGGLLAIFVLGAGLGCCVFSGPRYRGPVSDHFDGRRFKNPRPGEERGFSDFLKWVTHREQGPWGEFRDAPPGPPPPERVADGRMRVTFVNHSTALIQMDGVNLLTDPIWSERASPVDFAGPHRVRPPGIRFEDLPPIDAVLISHNHYDHLDLATLRRLVAAHHPRLFVPQGNAAFLSREGIRDAVDLDWWQSTELAPGVRLTAVPAQHFANRGLCDRQAALWAGFFIEGPAGRAYFAGDTGMGPHFQAMVERLGPPRLALLPIGAFRPRWFMERAHLGPDQAVEAQRILGAGTAAGIHFGTFRLADDGQDEPVEELSRELAARSPAPRFWVLGFGEGREVPPLGEAVKSMAGEGAGPAPEESVPNPPYSDR